MLVSLCIYSVFRRRSNEEERRFLTLEFFGEVNKIESTNMGKPTLYYMNMSNASRSTLLTIKALDLDVEYK